MLSEHGSVATSTGQNRLRTGRGSKERSGEGQLLAVGLLLLSPLASTHGSRYLRADPSLTRGGTLRVPRSRLLDRAPKHIRGLGVFRQSGLLSPPARRQQQRAECVRQCTLCDEADSCPSSDAAAHSERRSMMQSRIRCVASWLVVSLMCMGTAGHAALARSSSPEPSRAFRTPSAGILLLVVQNFVPIVGELIGT